MPYNSIFEIVIFLSLGAIILILARALPRVEDENIAYRSKKKRSFCVTKISLEKLDNSFNLVAHKSLRKMKILIMKADNFVTNKLKTVHLDNNKKESGSNGLPI